MLLDGNSSAWITARIVGVGDYRHVVIEVIGSSSFDGTVKFMGGVRRRDTDTPLRFSDGVNQAAPEGQAQDPWMFVDVNDLQDGASIDGDTGVSSGLSGTVRYFEVNTNVIDDFAVFVTERTAGSVTIVALLSTNE